VRSAVDDSFGGFLRDKRYVLYDRDTKFTQTFGRLLRASGVKPVVLPPRNPNLNEHCERFVRSIKEEALHQMMILGEDSLRYVLRQCLTQYYAERHHQGLDNQLIAQEGAVGRRTGQVARRERLGGLLSYYHREAA
jgi:putative transposase